MSIINQLQAELDAAKQRIYSLETDVIDARRVADEREEIIDDLSLALERISDKSEIWQRQGKPNSGSSFPYWNLGDIAYAALIKIGKREKRRG